MQRRSWILGGALVAGTATGALVFGRSRKALSAESSKALSRRSGPFFVPPGFDCHVLTRAGEPQSDRTRTPDLPDGMACFLGSDGNWILLRNHELIDDPTTGAYPGGQPREAYRPSAQGGVSRVVIAPQTLRVLSSNMVLTGTLRNCGGGPTPWGWLSCEEATEPEHGYSFLCSPEAGRLAPPRLIAAYGRFRHEAVAVDPDTFAAYLTEDDPLGCLYRFTPEHRNEPFVGRLEALRIVGRPGLHTEARLVPHAPVEIDWVPVSDPTARSGALREQARAKGAALFARGEGIWLDGSGVVFAATSGGELGQGQLFRHDFPTQTLTLVAEARSSEHFNGPDNLTVAPWGDVLVAEDGVPPNHLYLVRANGTMRPILRSAVSSSEIAGVCFSPDGTTLFCNLQLDGLTVAIRGPWETLRDDFA